MLMGQDNGPLISVLMGVLYWRESVNLLERAICSIQSQTYRNFELLICDDGSTEVACKYLDEVASRDERIHLIRGCPRTDLPSKLNWCLRVANGAFIARMDDDDFSHPQRFAVQMEYLRKKPQAAFVGCVADLEREGKPAGIRCLPARPEVKDFLFVQPFLHPTLIFRREVLKAAGGYSEEPRCLGCEDYDLLLRLYEAGYRGENIQEPLLIYTLPPVGSKKRAMALRRNEVKTRYVRFRALRLLPGALPYVVKPMVVGLIPSQLLQWMKNKVIVLRKDTIWRRIL